MLRAERSLQWNFQVMTRKCNATTDMRIQFFRGLMATMSTTFDSSEERYRLPCPEGCTHLPGL